MTNQAFTSLCWDLGPFSLQDFFNSIKVDLYIYMCQKTPIIVSRRSTLETVGRKVLAEPVCMGCLCRHALFGFL